jgi:hypothetical protein
MLKPPQKLKSLLPALWSLLPLPHPASWRTIQIQNSGEISPKF